MLDMVGVSFYHVETPKNSNAVNQLLNNIPVKMKRSGERFRGEERERERVKTTQ